MEPDLHEVIACLQNPSERVRAEAAFSLGESKDPTSVEPLIELLGQEQGYVRDTAVRALAKLNDPRAIEPLFACLPTNSTSLHLAVTDALRHIDGVDLGRLESIVGVQKTVVVTSTTSRPIGDRPTSEGEAIGVDIRQRSDRATWNSILSQDALGSDTIIGKPVRPDWLGALYWLTGSIISLVFIWIVVGGYGTWVGASARRFHLPMDRASLLSRKVEGLPTDVFLRLGTPRTPGGIAVMGGTVPSNTSAFFATVPRETRWWGPFHTNPFWAALLGGMLGLSLVLPQYCILTRRDRNGERWFGSALGSYLFAWLIVAAASNMDGLATRPYLIPPLAGGAAGLLQWHYWYNRAPAGSWIWPLAMLIGWGIAVELVGVIQGLMLRGLTEIDMKQLLTGDLLPLLGTQIGIWAGQGAAMGLGIGIPTGVAYAWMSRYPDKTASAPLLSAAQPRHDQAGVE